MDSNKTRLRKKRDEQRNRDAFVEIIGDPSLDIDGVYITLHSRSSVGSVDNSSEEGENVSPAKPSISDFFCDVENCLDSVLTIPDSIARFTKTYFHNVPEVKELTKKERKQIEQRLGKLFRARGISPVKRYFTVSIKKVK